MLSTHEEITRLIEETEVDAPVSPLEGYAAILKNLDYSQDELKLIKKGLKELWDHTKENEIPDAVSLTIFIETETEKLIDGAINLAATAIAFREAFKRDGGEGWHY